MPSALSSREMKWREKRRRLRSVIVELSYFILLPRAAASGREVSRHGGVSLAENGINNRRHSCSLLSIKDIKSTRPSCGGWGVVCVLTPGEAAATIAELCSNIDKNAALLNRAAQHIISSWREVTQGIVMAWWRHWQRNNRRHGDNNDMRVPVGMAHAARQKRCFEALKLLVS